jgi:Uma2 family endonuclease
MTLEEYYAHHPDDRRYELQAGLLLSEPHPGVEHGRVCMRVAGLLDRFAGPRRLGFTLIGEAGYLLAAEPPTVLIPDVSFLTLARGGDHITSRAPFPGAPDLAVEVLSPSNRPKEIRGKVAAYLAAGCPLVWVVDPERREVTVHAGDAASLVLRAEDRLECRRVVPGFSVRVRELFELWPSPENSRTLTNKSLRVVESGC